MDIPSKELQKKLHPKILFSIFKKQQQPANSAARPNKSSSWCYPCDLPNTQTPAVLDTLLNPVTMLPHGIEWDLNEGNSIYNIHGEVHSPLHLTNSMGGLSLIFPAFLALIILFLTFKQSLQTLRLFLWCFCACNRMGGSADYMLCPLSVVLDSSQNLGPLSTEVMEGQTGGVRRRSPLSLFHELRLFNGFRSHLTRAPNKMT